MKTLRFPRSCFCFVEILEARIAPAVHEWTGLGANNLWSNDANWVGGSPATDLSGNIDLVFHSNLTSTKRLVMENDIAGLVVDSITFDANGGTNATGGKTSLGYTLNGMPLIIDTGASGQNPFGIDITTGVADLTKGLTETINLRLILSANDATFRIQDTNAKLVLNGDVGLDGHTLTLDVPSNGNKTLLTLNGDLSNGNLTKNGNGFVQLAGNNSQTNTTVNFGVLVVTTDTGLGLRNLGVVTINNPAQVILRGGITVEKPLLNLNANSLGGGLGADGNTTNTFRGSVVLSAIGNVAMGAGVGAADANTRLIIDGLISGGSPGLTLSLNGAGVIEFTQNNTYQGVTNHNGNNGFGALQIDAPGGLGASGSANNMVLNRNGAGPNGSSLWLNFDGTMTESIGIAGAGVGGFGAVRVLGDHVVTITGNIDLFSGAPWTLGVDAAGGLLTLTGVIDSGGTVRPLTKVGAGLLVIGGASANTWVGGINVDDGTLRVTNTTATPLGTGGPVVLHNDSILDLRPGVVVPNEVQVGIHATTSGAGLISGNTFHSTLTLSANGRSGTYVDADGDLVKVTSSRGRLAEQDFVFKFSSDGHQQLQQLTLDAADAKTALNLQAKVQAGSGDGLANVGSVVATNIALGRVTIDGDLGRISSRDIAALTVNSMGVFGTTTQPANGMLTAQINGALGSLNVKATYTNEVLTANGRIGSIKIGASWLSGRISAGADIGSINVIGDMSGLNVANPVTLSAMGKKVAPKSGLDVAIGSIKVGGNVSFASILAGYSTFLSGFNADASVGSVTVGSWAASTLLAGVKAGSDMQNGTTDDVKLSGGVRDNAKIFSRIGAIVIKGTAEGSSGAGDHFGIVAEQIISARIGSGPTAVKLAFTPGPRGPADFFNVGSFGDFGIGEITL